MATFYLDHDVDRQIASAMRRRGHVASTAYDEGLEAADDDEQFLLAVQRAAILVTHNFNDFKLLL